jgi:hypothetical protein
MPEQWLKGNGQAWVRLKLGGDAQGVVERLDGQPSRESILDALVEAQQQVQALEAIRALCERRIDELEKRRDHWREVRRQLLAYLEK